MNCIKNDEHTLTFSSRVDLRPTGMRCYSSLTLWTGSFLLGLPVLRNCLSKQRSRCCTHHPLGQMQRTAGRFQKSEVLKIKSSFLNIRNSTSRMPNNEPRRSVYIGVALFLVVVFALRTTNLHGIRKVRDGEKHQERSTCEADKERLGKGYRGPGNKMSVRFQ